MAEFFKLTVEERAEWRANPTTKAALAMLMQEVAKQAEAVLVGLASGVADARARHDAGIHQGFLRAIDLLENEK